jgi:hypothetical protein
VLFGRRAPALHLLRDHADGDQVKLTGVSKPGLAHEPVITPAHESIMCCLLATFRRQDAPGLDGYASP